MRKILVLGSSSEIGSLVVRKLVAQGATVISIDAHGGDINIDFSNAAGRLEAIENVIDICPTQIDAIISTFKTSTTKPLAISSNFFGITQFIEGLYDEIKNSPKPRICILNFCHEIDNNSSELIEVMMKLGEKQALKFAQNAMLPNLDSNKNNFESSQKAIQLWVQTAANKSHWIIPKVLINTVTFDEYSTKDEIAEALIWLASDKNENTSGQVLGAKTVLNQALTSN